MLAEGDVDPAAGSRDEPTRLHVEGSVAERKQRIEVQVARALFLNSNNWVPPLAPDFFGLFRYCFFGARGDPKRRQKNIEKSKGAKGGPKSENKGPEP